MSFNVTALNAFRNVNLGGENAIANLGQDDAIVKKNDYHGGIGKIFRGTPTKAANNAIRAELLRSLGNVFGLSGMAEKDGKATFTKEFMDKLEGYLGPAFKREDFGVGADGTVSSGKPLTQRRIQAVARAVADAAGRFDNAVAAAKAVATFPYDLEKDPRFGTLDALVESAMKAAGGDEALIGLLQKKRVIESVLVGGDSRIRTEEDALAKVAALKANVDELRAATKGNRALFEAGVRGLAQLKGKTFARGCITAMVKEASAAKIGAIRSLSASSDAQQIHDAVAEYHTRTQGIMTKTNALSSFSSRSAEEYSMTREFIGKLLLARCTPAKLEAMDAAFHSVSATKTSRLYDYVLGGAFSQDGYDFRKVEAIKDAARRIGFTMLDLSANVSDALGREPFAINDYEGQPDDEMKDADVMSDLSEFADQELAEADALVEE